MSIKNNATQLFKGFFSEKDNIKQNNLLYCTILEISTVKTNKIMKFKTLLFSLSCLTIGFSQDAKAQYCAPNYLFGCGLGDRIESFTTTGVTILTDNNTGCSAGNWKVDTGMSVTYNAGASYSQTVTSGTISDNVQVFIDFNDDMTFGTGESVGGLNGPGISVLTYNVAIPSGAASGPHRMRIVLTGDGVYPTIVPCPTQNYGGGEVHDYTANILGGACDTPMGLAASAITFDGATFNWTAVTGATGYQYALNTSPTPPGSGTPTTLLTYTATGLMSGTTYYFHLRTACGNQFSPWITISFTTAACPSPTSITQSAVTGTSATISWAAISGAQGYVYNATTSATPPATGIYTTSTSGPVTGLTPNTAYHAWVRTVCGQADSSAWTSDTFSTPVSVVNVGYDNFSLQAYPNPVKHSLHIAALGQKSGVATIQLMDVTGKLIDSYTLTGTEMNISMSNLSTGVYFIRYADMEHRQVIKVNKD